jgi:hypothetical protein
VVGQIPNPVGLLVPVSITLRDGRDVTVQLMFGPEVASQSQFIEPLIGALVNGGVPVKAYAPRQQNTGWGGNNGNRGGYSNNRGNWQR